MASRDKKDLRIELVVAYDLAVAKYKELYPVLPQPFITCTYRSKEEQDETFFKGRDKLGNIVNRKLIVTNARGGQSPHNYNVSFAFDIAFTDSRGKLDWSDGLFAKFNDCIQAVAKNVVWGFDWNGNKKQDKNDFDRPHFELKEWKNLIK